MVVGDAIVAGAVVVNALPLVCALTACPEASAVIATAWFWQIKLGTVVAFTMIAA
jgi:hypothetical protein